MTTIPKSYSFETADLYNFSTESAFWVNNWVANQAYSRYSYMIKDIRKVQNEIEDSFANRQASLEAEALALYKQEPAKAVAMLNEYSNNEAQKATARYLNLAQYLLVKYLDGNMKREKDGKFERTPEGLGARPARPGFDDNYKEVIIRETGDKYLVP